MIKYILKKPYHNGMTCQGSCKNIKKKRLYTKTGGEIYPAPVFLYLNRHSFHTVLQFK